MKLVKVRAGYVISSRVIPDHGELCPCESDEGLRASRQSNGRNV